MKLSFILAPLLLAFFSLSSALAITETTNEALSAFGKRSTISDILTDIEDAVSCTACEALLVVLKVLAATGNDNFVDVITEICILAVSQTPFSCRAIAHNLENRVSMTLMFGELNDFKQS